MSQETNAVQPPQSGSIPCDKLDLILAAAEALERIHRQLRQTTIPFIQTPGIEIVKRGGTDCLRFSVTLFVALHLASPTSGITSTKSDDSPSSSS